VKAWYLESHKSFYKLSFEISYKICNPCLSYGELEFERCPSKLLLSFSKGLNKKNHNSRYIENFGHQNLSKKISLILMFLHQITIESFTHYKTLYEEVWSLYSLIMDCYKFLSILLKVHYIMTIKKYPWNSYNVIILLYNIVMLNHFSFYWLYLITWLITNPKILQKLSCDNILWTV